MAEWNDPKRLLPLFTVTCGKRWEELEPDSESTNRRHCSDCSRFVYQADSEAAFEKLRSEGHCVNVPMAPNPRRELTGAAPPPDILFPNQSAARQVTSNSRMSVRDVLRVVSTLATCLVLFGWACATLFILIRTASSAIFQLVK